MQTIYISAAAIRAEGSPAGGVDVHLPGVPRSAGVQTTAALQGVPAGADGEPGLALGVPVQGGLGCQARQAG